MQMKFHELKVGDIFVPYRSPNSMRRVKKNEHQVQIHNREKMIIPTNPELEVILVGTVDKSREMWNKGSKPKWRPVKRKRLKSA